jgi:hypothetical protein
VSVQTGGELATETVPGPLLVVESLAIARILSVSPSQTAPGTSLTLQVTAENTHFVAGISTARFSPGGITVLAIRVLSPTVVELDIRVELSAAPGARDLTITTGGEEAAKLGAFEVGNPPPPANVTLALFANQASFGPGEAFVLGLSAQNLPSANVGDFYFGALLPDNNTLVFFTDLALNFSFTNVSNIGALRPFVAGVNLTAPFSVTRVPLFAYRWVGTEPRGRYLFFFFATRPGALTDNDLALQEILAAGVVQVVLSGPGGAAGNPGGSIRGLFR